MVNVDKNGELIKYSPNVLKPRSKDFVPESTPLGSKIIIRPRLYVDKDGNKCAEPGEKFDLDGYIQAQAASTDLAAIVARFQSGDIEALHVHENGFTGDATILPKDLYDLAAYKKIYSDAESNFAKLPEDIRALFKNDSTEFFNSVMNGHVNEIMKNYETTKAKAAAEKAAAEKVAEVKKEGGVE